MRRIVITGSECTGKTTLAERLADHYGTVWVPEYVRYFVLDKGGPPEREDVHEIARGQLNLEDTVARDASGLLILDTDLLSTVVYAQYYYGESAPWIEETWERRKGDLYLLAGIDVPWVADGHQRDRPTNREEMQWLFRKALEERSLPFVRITGTVDERVVTAVQAIDAMSG